MPSQTQEKSFIDQVVKSNMEFYGAMLDEAMTWIGNNCDPEDVFSKDQLERWAESEGYIKPTDNE
jgi:hypothetical protein